MYKKNKHHLFYPRRAYNGGLAKRFRNLPCNIIRLDVEVHNMIHFLQTPPEKPSPSAMQRMIARHDRKECGCT